METEVESAADDEPRGVAGGGGDGGGFAEGCLDATKTVTYDALGRLEGRGGSETYEFETLRVRYDGPESVDRAAGSAAGGEGGGEG